ncbi:Uncharacterised protein [Vibrio cholerae]|uniref:Uncharacterized protein n=1 Tax=Vibrio cholerae TaxID=666 RepID=A0A655QKW3_VIBCL|nr:Uncharacterised protein [Vibrio cholerae]
MLSSRDLAQLLSGQPSTPRYPPDDVPPVYKGQRNPKPLQTLSPFQARCSHSLCLGCRYADPHECRLFAARQYDRPPDPSHGCNHAPQCHLWSDNRYQTRKDTRGALPQPETQTASSY